MNKYKITAKCKKNQPPIKDRDGKLLWDGKPKLITLTIGEESVTKFMFENMKTYTDPALWQLKLVKMR